MDIATLLRPEHVIGGFQATDKRALLRELASQAAIATDLPAPTVVEALLARETLGSTGIGHGIAIPHASITALSRFFGMFVRLQRPIDFDSIDEQPVDLVFLLLSLPGAGKGHLAALAAITRRLRDPDVAGRLRRTRDPVELYAVLTG